jgi:hypothetical protein
VSRPSQGRTGLGIDAQREAIRRFAEIECRPAVDCVSFEDPAVLLRERCAGCGRRIGRKRRRLRRISLQRSSLRRKVMPNNHEYPGMSVEGGRER